MSKKENIYFDHNATTPLRSGVWQAMAEVSEQPLNASSIHSSGRLAKKILNAARTSVQKSFGAEGATIVFTSSGTESNNMALVCIKGVEKIITTEAEHISISKPASFMNNTLVAVDGNGIVQLDKLREICESLNKLEGKEPQTNKFLVSILHANNETGVIQPVQEIADIVFASGGLLHIDASQSAGKIPFDFNSLRCDMATISAHKFGGSKGAAVLIIKSGLEVLPMIHGGGQEKFLRAGTENISAIVGMAKAAEIATANMEKESVEIESIRNHIEKGILDISPDAKIYGTNSPRLPNTVSVFLPDATSETHLINFDLEGVNISAGSACSSGRVVTSHVLVAMGVPQEEAKSTIRISLGWNSTLKQAETFLYIWQKIYSKQKQKAA